MEYKLSGHAADELIIRNIPRAVLDDVLNRPEQVLDGTPGKKIYQSRVTLDGKLFLVRVVITLRTQPPLVITVYRTTQIERYWKKT